VSETEPPTAQPSAWAVEAVAVSLVFLVAGILWPGVAGVLLRVLVVSLALGWGAARALRANLPTAAVHDSYSPFDGEPLDIPASAIPDVVWRRARWLTAIDDHRGGDLRPIPWPIARSLIHEAVRRLEKGHGLRFGNPADTARIRHMVSEATWTLLGQGAGADTADLGRIKARWVPLAQMDDILDDLERL
jgi:hypothetical protein